MNRASDEGNHLFVLRDYSLLCSLLHFLRFKFKRFNQEVFCEKAVLKFPKKQIQWASAIPNSRETRKKVRDSGKFKILVFYKALGKFW